MSGVRDVLAARQGAAFGEALRGLIKSRGYANTNAFLRKVYGHREGKPKGSGQLYPALNGSGPVTDKSLKRWAAALDVPVGKLLALRDHPADLTGTSSVRGAASSAVPSAAKSREPTVTPDVVPPAAKPSGQEQFSLVIDQNGTAALRLNLVGVPMATAMRAMAALTGAGLIKAPPEEG